MGTLMEDEIKRWTARRKAALVLEIIQGKTTVAEPGLSELVANNVRVGRLTRAST